MFIFAQCFPCTTEWSSFYEVIGWLGWASSTINFEIVIILIQGKSATSQKIARMVEKFVNNAMIREHGLEIMIVVAFDRVVEM